MGILVLVLLAINISLVVNDLYSILPPFFSSGF